MCKCAVCMQVDVAPEQQPAAASVATETNMHKLAELTQAKSATEPAPSGTLRSRSSTLAPASDPEEAAQRASSEPGAADLAETGAPVASRAAVVDSFLEASREAAQLPDLAPGSRASGLTLYRAPTAPLQRSKLESFDRKIGRAANSLKVPCLQPASLCKSEEAAPDSYRVFLKTTIVRGR